MSPLCAQKRTSLESRLFGPVPPAERRQPPRTNRSTGDRSRSHGAGHLSGDRSILYKLGYVVTEIGETQRIPAHAIAENLIPSSSGALVAAIEGSMRPVTVQVTQPGLATVIQCDLRIP